MPSARAPGPAPARTPLANPNRFAQELFTGLPRRYDLLEAILSLGQNGRWRRAMVDHVVPAAPARVLDVATGTAGVALQLADRTPGRVVGVDLTEAMLRRGRENIARSHAGSRVQLVAGRAEQLPFPDDAFDAVTFTYLVRYVANPAATLVELARVLKPGAPVASLEFHVPPSRFWRAAWWLYTRGVLPAAGGLAGRSWFRVGRFLGPSISKHYRRYPLSSTVAMWGEAGLIDVEFRLMSLGGGVVMWGRKGG
jgi:demethylmenaquinone methyltransferase / 2-methoxy-6-polyprenyl-1,4-benzoquinol methylase